jgi:hypothetical protein
MGRPCGEKTHIAVIVRIASQSPLMASITPARFAQTLNCDLGHSDQSATISKSRNAYSDSLTTRSQPHVESAAQGQEAVKKETEKLTMSAVSTQIAATPSVLQPSCRKSAASALSIVRDGVITGEGPTTKGRIHFSRTLDADDAAWCARILTADAVEHQPVSREEALALFEISDAAAERCDGGRFDDLLAKAVAHHAASESGLPVPPRTVALSPDTDIASWAPIHAANIDTSVLEWIAKQMRGKRRSNHTLAAMVATVVGAAALPLIQLPNVLDIGLV